MLKTSEACSISLDTTREAMVVYIDALRAMPGEKKSEMTAELCRGLRMTIESGIRHRHPEYAPRQICLAYMRLTFGKKLFEEVFPAEAILP